MKWLNIFSKVENHSQQLTRIGFCTFIGLTGMFSIVTRTSGEVRRGLAVVPLPSFPEWPAEIPLVVLAAAILSVLYRVISLHAILVKLFGIRNRYELHSILIPMAQSAGISVTHKIIEQLKHKHSELMGELFWKYANYTDPKIDKHLIDSAFDFWGWVYICIQLSFTALLLSIWVLLRGHSEVALWLSVLIVILLLIATYEINQCRSVTSRQVLAILSDSARAKKVERKMRALVFSQGSFP